MKVSYDPAPEQLVIRAVGEIEISPKLTPRRRDYLYEVLRTEIRRVTRQEIASAGEKSP
jgi:hypothetical protein